MNKYKHQEYNFLKDPHLIYFLQSPYKIAQLLKSRRYKISGCKLIQIDSNQEYDIDPYVLKRIDMDEVNRVINFEQITEAIEPALKSDASLESRYAQFRQTRMKYSQIGRIQPSQSKEKQNKRCQKMKKYKQQEYQLPYIRGLKQFRKKML